MVWKVYHFVLPSFRLHFTHGNKLSEFRETLWFGFKWEGDLSQHFDEVFEPLWSEPDADDWFKKGSKKAEVKLLRPPLPPSRSWPPVLSWNMVVVNIVHHNFKCCVGKSSCSETFRLRGSFHCGAENVNGRFTEMSFLWRRSRFADCPRCLFIVSSTFAQKKVEGGLMEERIKKETHHIKSDYIVSLMEQFVSQFCQQHALARLPGGRCLQPAEPSGIVYFTLDAL